MNNRNILDDDCIGRLLFKLSLPAFFGMFVTSLYNIVDTIFIGHYVGPLGIAGLSIVFPVQMLSMGLGLMTGIGGASLVSRLIGAENNPKAEKALGNAKTLTLIFSLLITAFGLYNVDFWCLFIGASETTLPYTRDYMTIILIGTIFMTYAITSSTLIRAEGNAKVAMTGMIIGAVLNIILDAIFIIPLDMGLRGAALATVIAQVVSVIYFIIYYLSGKSYLKLHMKNLLLELSIVKEILAIGVSSLARTLSVSISGILINRTLLVYGGDYAVSTFGILGRLMMFALMPTTVTGQGLQPILGFNYGAKRFDRALKSINIAMLAATTSAVIIFLILYFIPDVFIRIFTSDEEIISIGTHAAHLLFLSMPLIGFMTVGALIFQSIGKALLSFIATITRTFLFLIPLVIILPLFWKLDGVWLAIPIADGLTCLMTFVLLAPLIRELRNMKASYRLEAGAVVAGD